MDRGVAQAMGASFQSNWLGHTPQRLDEVLVIRSKKSVEKALAGLPTS